jgi:hypothetical protein
MADSEFDAWFKNFNSWDVSYDSLLQFSFVKGEDGDADGDTVYTSPNGSEMTRFMCHHWIAFYSAAKAGWQAAKDTPGNSL